MAEGNERYDWQESMRRLRNDARNWEGHDKIRRAIETLRESNVRLHVDVEICERHSRIEI